MPQTHRFVILAASARGQQQRPCEASKNMRPGSFSMSSLKTQRSIKNAAWTALLVLLGAAGAFAQKPAPTPRPTGTPIEENAGSTKVFEVRLPVTVYDPRVKKPKTGLVAGLSQSDFQV